jgi:hypothetical protein
VSGDGDGGDFGGGGDEGDCGGDYGGGDADVWMVFVD